jgi:uncharacterized protein
MDRLQRLAFIEEVPAAKWNAASADLSLWSSPQWLLSVEPAFSPRRQYLLAEHGTMVVYTVDANTYPNFDPHRLLLGEQFLADTAGCRSPEEDAELRSFVARLPDGVLRPATVSVIPWGFSAGLWAQDDATLDGLLDELDRLTIAWETPATGVLYVEEGNHRLRDRLRARGYIEALLSANCVLSLNFDSFQGYLYGLTRDRRTKIRREVRRFEQTGIHFTSGALSEHINRIAHLAASLQARHGHGYDPDWQAQVLLNIERTTQPYQRLAIAERPDGELAGFVVYFEKDRTLYPKMAGFDSEPGTREYLYFNLGYYEMIRRGLAAGMGQIEYGIDAYEAKIIRGCQARRQYAYLRVPDEYRGLVSAVAERVSAGWLRRLEGLARLRGDKDAATVS